MEPISLYIQIRDGKPYQHPIAEENMQAAFSDIDLNNLPKDMFAKFIRVPMPEVGDFEVVDNTTYEWDGDVVKDVHHVRPMNDEERAEKTRRLEEYAIMSQNLMIERATDFSQNAASEEDRAAWAKYLEEIKAWRLEGVSPITPPFPDMPTPPTSFLDEGEIAN